MSQIIKIKFKHQNYTGYIFFDNCKYNMADDIHRIIKNTG